MVSAERSHQSLATYHPTWTACSSTTLGLADRCHMPCAESLPWFLIAQVCFADVGVFVWTYSTPGQIDCPSLIYTNYHEAKEVVTIRASMYFNNHNATNLLRVDVRARKRWRWVGGWMGETFRDVTSWDDGSILGLGNLSDNFVLWE